MSSTSGNSETKIEKKAIHLDIGKRCLETSPCKHYCEVKWSDGTVESQVLLGARYLISNQYWNAMSEKNKKHFEYMNEDRHDGPRFDKSDSKFSSFLEYIDTKKIAC